VAELRQLLLRRRDHPRMRVPDVQAPDAAGEVDEGVAVDVGDRGPVSLRDHDGEVDRERLRDDLLLAVEDLLRARPGDVGADVDRARDGHRRHDIARDGGPAFLESDLADNPFQQFAAWFEEAAKVVDAPEVMTIATATADGRPSARMLLLKEHGPDGFVFFSGYESRKGRELTENPRAALVFYWRPLGRQVRVEGGVERLDPADSETYFRTRPLQSRYGAWASHQSEVIPDRESLERRFEEAQAAYGDDVPLPGHWGGYRLRPHTIEFWQHRDNRLHDRFRYRLEQGAWVIERLSP
jgi:pyridoxamine 5'-phosphate oxidase